MVGGLVRSLVEWVPTSVTSVSVLSGPLAILGYLAGSIPFGYLLSRRRLRRQLAGDPSVRTTRSGEDPLDTPGVIGAGALAALATLLVTTVAWDVAITAAPRGNIGAIGTFSNQAVGAWVSVALWTGMAAVVGNIAPVWTAFRGATGLAPAVALVLAHVPVVFVVCAATFLVAYALTRETRLSLLITLPVAVSVEYLAWIADVQTSWGVTNGPEVTLWIAVLAGALAARNLRPAAGRRPAG
ncbi:MAG: glycerol-3-phosphate acyltransferase [Actinomycetota bacterium]|nr:glycerol-3-phosphate acyltransferase [Actinomycetota bacterium]